MSVGLTHEVDQTVYELYGLTEEEIQVVEEAVAEQPADSLRANEVSEQADDRVESSRTE